VEPQIVTWTRELEPLWLIQHPVVQESESYTTSPETDGDSDGSDDSSFL
jgi:hypothetical protein